MNLLPKQRQRPDPLCWEKEFWRRDFEMVAGLDEAGRGAWAGPVVAAAVIFKPQVDIPEIDDSKKLSPKKREELYYVICREAVSYGVGVVSSEVIDQINILEASLEAMRIAVAQCAKRPDYLLIDGNRGIGLRIPQKTLVSGDALSMSIGAASILAKVTRDRMMADMELEFPEFGFSYHKGYGTKRHLDELKRNGVLPCHRRSFEPVKSIINHVRHCSHLLYP